MQGAAGIGQKKMETLKKQLHTDDNCKWCTWGVFTYATIAVILYFLPVNNSSCQQPPLQLVLGTYFCTGKNSRDVRMAQIRRTETSKGCYTVEY